MLATPYTSVPVRYPSVRKRLHNEDPQRVLADRLEAVFVQRELSARGVGKKIGVSNRTVQNLINGSGNPGLKNLVAVAKHLDIPLWQLLCPGIPPETFGSDQVHELLDSFCTLSDLGRARLLQNLEDIATAEHARRSASVTPTPKSGT